MSQAENLTRWVYAAHIEQDLIDVQATTGHNVTFANRPLTPQEEQAGTRFGDIDAIVEDNTAQGAVVVDALYATAAGAIVAEIFADKDDDDAVETGAAIGIMVYLIGNPSASFLIERTRSARFFTGLISNSFAGGAFTMIDEAARQGVDVTGWNDPDIPDVLEVLGDDIADHTWLSLLERGIDEYTDPGSALEGRISEADFKRFLDALSRKRTIDRLHQANQAALGMGRTAVAEEHDGDIRAVYASEILDKSTCGPCSAVDGRQYASIFDAKSDYPHGIYKDCLGGSRCRGTIIVIYNTNAGQNQLWDVDIE